jgi:hypothetical protein
MYFATFWAIKKTHLATLVEMSNEVERSTVVQR